MNLKLRVAYLNIHAFSWSFGSSDHYLDKSLVLHLESQTKDPLFAIGKKPGWIPMIFMILAMAMAMPGDIYVTAYVHGNANAQCQCQSSIEG